MQGLRLLKTQLSMGSVDAQEYERRRIAMIDAMTGTTYSVHQRQENNSNDNNYGDEEDVVRMENLGSIAQTQTAQPGYAFMQARTPAGQLPVDWVALAQADRERKAGEQQASAEAKKDGGGKDGWTPVQRGIYNWELFHASANNNVRRVEELVRGGCDVDMRDSDTGNTPLILAASKGQKHVLMWLVENGAQVNAQNNKGETALHLLVQNKHTTTAVWLVKHGGDIDMENSRHFTPVDMALPWLQQELKEAHSTRLLLERARNARHQHQHQPAVEQVAAATAATGGSAAPTLASSSSSIVTPMSSSSAGGGQQRAGLEPLPKMGAVSDAAASTQEVLKIYLKNNAYKSVVVTGVHKAGDVCTMMAEKIGMEQFANALDLVDCIKGEERRLDPGANVLRVKRSWPVILSTTDVNIEPCRFKVVPRRGCSEAASTRYRSAMYGK
jgi:Ankyrin repeats (3 copies)/Ras association (RalGDS/AF-6) domain